MTIIQPNVAYLFPTQQLRNPGWVVIPRFFEFTYRGEVKQARMNYTVRPHLTMRGYFDYGQGGVDGVLTRLPTITWAGRAGYWARGSITDEFLRINGVTELDIDYDQYRSWRHTLTRAGIPVLKP